MGRRFKLKYFIVALLIIIVSISYYVWQSPPYKITNENIKSMYCTFWNKDGEHKIDVNDSDKEIILSEINKMKRSGVEGQVGTIGYDFTIELVDERKFTFYQNTSSTVSLQRDEFFRNIIAPKTAAFIKKFLSEHNIEP